MTQSQTPVLFLIFNRPDTTKLVFERIQQAKPTKLFIAADGARADRVGEAELCAQARSVVDKVDWDCEVHKLFQDKNLGCKWGPSTAIDWFFQHVEEGIILEDDCVPDPSFFPYCQELLEKYRDNPKILSISGFNFGYSPTNAFSYSFSRYMNMWGWATWRRSLKLIDYEISDWDNIDQLRFLHDGTRESIIDIDWKWIKDWRRTFNDLIHKHVDAWDYCWIYAGFKYKTLSIFPHQNLVENIGFNQQATHTHDESSQITKIQSGSIGFPLVHAEKITRNVDFEENYIKKVWQSYHRRDLIYQLKTFTREELLPKIGIH
jgi:hypothetical protein